MDYDLGDIFSGEERDPNHDWRLVKIEGGLAFVKHISGASKRALRKQVATYCTSYGLSKEDFTKGYRVMNIQKLPVSLKFVFELDPAPKGNALG